MNQHLQMPLWQQVLLVLFLPVVITLLIMWRYLQRALSGSKKPLRKRKRRRF